MEGLIPLIINAVKRQRPQNAYIRCLSDNSTSGRSYHRLLGGDAASGEGSFHRRTLTDYETSSKNTSNAYAKSFLPASNDIGNNGLRQRGHVDHGYQATSVNTARTIYGH